MNFEQYNTADIHKIAGCFIGELHPDIGRDALMLAIGSHDVTDDVLEALAMGRPPQVPNRCPWCGSDDIYPSAYVHDGLAVMIGPRIDHRGFCDDCGRHY